MNSYDKLIELIDASDEETKQIVICQLVNRGIDGLHLILNAIRNGSGNTGIILRQAILQIKDPKIKYEMFALLGDTNPYIRHTAYRVLSRYQDLDVVQILEEKIGSKSFNDGILAAEAIGEGKHFNSLPILRKNLESASDKKSIYYSYDLILAIAYSMAQLGDGSALPYILKLCEDKDPYVRLKSIELLKYFSGPEVFKALKKALSRRNNEIRQDALDGLFFIGTKDAANLIWNLCKDKNLHISERAMYRLAQLTGKEVDINDIAMGFDKWLERNKVILDNKYCYRLGQPINVPSLVKTLTEDKPEYKQYRLLDEIFVITGNRFGKDPEIWFYVKEPDYKSLVNDWLKENESKYINGKLYKFGFLQDII